MASRKSTVVDQSVLTAPQAPVEPSATAAAQAPVEPSATAAAQPVVKEQTANSEKKKNAEKAAMVARNYGVKTVWCTADGIYWATTSEQKAQLPDNRGDIEEYTFK